MTSGSVQVDGSRAPGTSAIFAGNLISSEDRPANLQYSDGTSGVMNPGAIMAVYREHSVLQRGIALQRGIGKHPVLANGLRISGATPTATALIGVRDASYFEVAAKEGESDVWTSSGDLVARVEPGKTLNFTIGQAPAGTQPQELKLCGVLGANYLITDHSTYVTYQLQGAGLASFLGKTVQVTGTISGGSPSSPMAQTVAVSGIKKMNDSCQRGSMVLWIFVAIGGAALIGLAAAGDLTPSPSPVTPATP